MVGERIDALEYGGDDKENAVLGNGLQHFQSMALAFAIVIAAFPSTAYSYPQANREQALSAYW